MRRMIAWSGSQVRPGLHAQIRSERRSCRGGATKKADRRSAPKSAFLSGTLSALGKVLFFLNCRNTQLRFTGCETPNALSSSVPDKFGLLSGWRPYPRQP